MLITLVAATPFEIQELTEWLQANFASKEASLYRKDDVYVQILVTGVGIALTALNLGFYFAKQKPDLAINAGIAGAFDRKSDIGTVVNITSERFGDLGAENADGSFQDIHEMGLINANESPFENGAILNKLNEDFTFLPKAKGLTVNKVHGSHASIDLIRSKYDCDVESMEGAAFFLACRLAEVNFLEIRAISNYVEARNKENWNIPLAIKNLNKVLMDMITSFVKS